MLIQSVNETPIPHQRPRQPKLRDRQQNSWCPAPGQAARMNTLTRPEEHAGRRRLFQSACLKQEVRAQHFCKERRSRTLRLTLVPFGMAVSSTSRRRMLQATSRTETDCKTESRSSALRPQAAAPTPAVPAMCRRPSHRVLRGGKGSQDHRVTREPEGARRSPSLPSGPEKTL